MARKRDGIAAARLCEWLLFRLLGDEVRQEKFLVARTEIEAYACCFDRRTCDGFAAG